MKFKVTFLLVFVLSALKPFACHCESEVIKTGSYNDMVLVNDYLYILSSKNIKVTKLKIPVDGTSEKFEYTLMLDKEHQNLFEEKLFEINVSKDEDKIIISSRSVTKHFVNPLGSEAYYILAS